MNLRIRKIKNTLLALIPLMWVITSVGNLGLVSSWLPELIGIAPSTPFFPKAVIMVSIFIFFVGVAQLFFAAIQSMLIKEF